MQRVAMMRKRDENLRKGLATVAVGGNASSRALAAYSQSSATTSMIIDLHYAVSARRPTKTNYGYPIGRHIAQGMIHFSRNKFCILTKFHITDPGPNPADRSAVPARTEYLETADGR